ncbi:hypothetical protein T552_03405 [Pneumocystis carinii B80]|uniref:RWD domain-containing protein n=1 Tax=Pneumocystis carinii (strain B80) TaxID=1408658 RepID=A0A0W4ZBJ2_PNEC8|nr:hypothetical protein T552_03405 [Pneumocystis carinii B80]KTW25792.1 hypothetical protein T552_03405 [Pneumocystis carinii B80]
MSFKVLDDEFVAINSIYPSCFKFLDGNAKIYSLKIPKKPYYIVLQFPETYPYEKPYIIESKNIEKSIVKNILAQIPYGDVCIFELIRYLEEELSQKDFNTLNDYKVDINISSTLDFASKEDNEKHNYQNEIPWIISDPLVSKKSKFIGRMVKVNSLDMVYAALKSLQYEKSLANATHNIWAYRLEKNDKIIYDNDDDGEKGAGSNLSHLLDSMDVRNVLVVVTRWYGGINLGPSRFKLINSSAKAALLLGNSVNNKSENDKVYKKKGSNIK